MSDSADATQSLSGDTQVVVQPMTRESLFTVATLNNLSDQLQRQTEHMHCWQQYAGQSILPYVAIEVADRCIDELDKVISASSMPETVALAATMPGCVELTLAIRDKLLQGGGVALIDRLPIERYSVEQSRFIVHAIASLVAPLMQQSKRGTLLYDVRDTESLRPQAGGHCDRDDSDPERYKNQPLLRRSITNSEQPFHTDGSWLSPTPHFVGLFCIRSSQSGGGSVVSSLAAAVDYFIKSDSRNVIQELVSPTYWNRMGEQAIGSRSFSCLPSVELHRHHGLVVRHYLDYMKTGCELAGESVPASLSYSLLQLERRLHCEAASVFHLKAGQLLYLNNWTVAHARGKYTDESEQGRHLIRVWNSPSHC